MFTRLKICGITTVEDAQMCAEVGVDMLGFNFYPGSPRFIAMNTARDIIQKIPFFINSVGILVRPMLQQVKEVIRKSNVDAIQIYQPLDFNDFNLINIPVFAASSINEIDDIQTYSFKEADMILLDNSTKNASGGTGKTFNWEQIPAGLGREKMILAGGINPQNVEQALQQVNPAIIDVASGSENYPGKKDRKKVHDLVQHVLKHNLNQLKSLNPKSFLE